jgi:molybdate transport system ATP-binding protein
MSLRLQKISLSLHEFVLSVDVDMGAAITGVQGPSGAGKTTLLEIVAGLRRPHSGSVVLNGRVLTDSEGRLYVPVNRRRVGYVPQDLALFPHLNTKANLTYGHSPNGQNAISAERVIEVLELASLLARPVHQLSGGERQRVALGRALLANPEILMLDEPLSSLDDRLKARILPYIKAIHLEFKVPIIYVTHSRMELAAICDEVLTMEKGEITSVQKEVSKPE